MRLWNVQPFQPGKQMQEKHQVRKIKLLFLVVFVKKKVVKQWENVYHINMEVFRKREDHICWHWREET